MQCAGASNVIKPPQMGDREAQGYRKRGRGRKEEGQIQSTIFAALQLAWFPVFIPIAGRSIHPHTFFESLGYVTAFALFFLLRSRGGDAVSKPLRWATLAAAFGGGTLGSKILYWLEDPHLTLQHL